MKRYRVIVHGVFRQPTRVDKDGSGFYTARCVQAQHRQAAGKLALDRVASDPRVSHSEFDGSPRTKLEIDYIVTLHEDDDCDESPLGIIYYDGPTNKA